MLLQENKELIFVLQGHIFYNKKIELNPIVKEEILTYGIQTGEVVVDLGTGKGQVPFYIGLLSLNNTVYLNEIEPKKIKFLAGLFSKLPKQYSPDYYKIVTGKETSSKLPKKSCDKIIVRNTYHHFAFKKKMLKSISKSLKSDGTLIIVEAFIEDNPDFACSKLMSRNKLIMQLKKYGYQLIKEQKVGKVTLLKYKVK